MNQTPAAVPSPVTIGSVMLRARDMARLAAFYEDKLGLDRISAAPDRVSLGSGGNAYLHIEPAARQVPEPDTAAGLFHTAFLLPDRTSLGRWFLRAHGLGVSFEGASDHAVSEAFYLSDPEGNGIEIYRDRAPTEWRRNADGSVEMTTARMDVEAVVALGRAAQEGDGRFPAASCIGHVHLKVGAAVDAERFYVPALQLDVTHRRSPDAVFMSWGGYHHHIAANNWMSRGAGKRAVGAPGLGEVAFAVKDAALRTALVARAGGSSLDDPWGNRIVIG
jgi:catechol 2,3-dioxygenase